MKRPSKDKKTFPLTEPQKALLWSLVFSLEKNNAKRENNIPMCFYDSSEDSNLDAMEKAFNKVIETNDSLRLRIYRSIKGIRQYVGEYEYEILPRKTIENLEKFIETGNKVFENIINVFDDQLYAATLFAFHDGSGGIIMNFHHMTADGYSCSLIMERFEYYYNLFKKEKAIPEKDKTYSIQTFFESESKYKKSKMFKEDFKYWWKKYNHQPGYSFPAGHRSLHGYEGIEDFSISSSTVRRIHELQKKTGCSEQAFVLALSAITTFCLTEKQVFMLTSLTHGRRNFALKQTIGCMMNPLPLAFCIDPSISAEKMIQNTYKDLLEALTHARFPMSYQMMIGLKYCFLRGFNFLHYWFFVSLMDYEKFNRQSEYHWEMIEAGFIAEPLYCFLSTPSNDEMDYRLLYQNKKFSPEKIHKMVNAYQKILNIILDYPDITLEELSNKVKEES